jgi:hypothetical protein
MAYLGDGANAIAADGRLRKRHCEERSDEAIQLRAQRASRMRCIPGKLSFILVRLPARCWIASLRSQ